MSGERNDEELAARLRPPERTTADEATTGEWTKRAVARSALTWTSVPLVLFALGKLAFELPGEVESDRLRSATWLVLMAVGGSLDASTSSTGGTMEVTASFLLLLLPIATGFALWWWTRRVSVPPELVGRYAVVSGATAAATVSLLSLFSRIDTDLDGTRVQVRVSWIVPAVLAGSVSWLAAGGHTVIEERFPQVLTTAGFILHGLLRLGGAVVAVVTLGGAVFVFRQSAIGDAPSFGQVLATIGAAALLLPNLVAQALVNLLGAPLQLQLGATLDVPLAGATLGGGRELSLPLWVCLSFLVIAAIWSALYHRRLGVSSADRWRHLTIGCGLTAMVAAWAAHIAIEATGSLDLGILSLSQAEGSATATFSVVGALLRGGILGLVLGFTAHPVVQHRLDALPTRLRPQLAPAGAHWYDQVRAQPTRPPTSRRRAAALFGLPFIVICVAGAGGMGLDVMASRTVEPSDGRVEELLEALRQGDGGIAAEVLGLESAPLSSTGVDAQMSQTVRGDDATFRITWDGGEITARSSRSKVHRAWGGLVRGWSTPEFAGGLPQLVVSEPTGDDQGLGVAVASTVAAVAVDGHRIELPALVMPGRHEVQPLSENDSLVVSSSQGVEVGGTVTIQPSWSATPQAGPVLQTAVAELFRDCVNDDSTSLSAPPTSAAFDPLLCHLDGLFGEGYRWIRAEAPPVEITSVEAGSIELHSTSTGSITAQDRPQNYRPQTAVVSIDGSATIDADRGLILTSIRFVVQQPPEVQQPYWWDEPQVDQGNSDGEGLITAAGRSATDGAALGWHGSYVEYYSHQFEDAQMVAESVHEFDPTAILLSSDDHPGMTPGRLYVMTEEVFEDQGAAATHCGVMSPGADCHGVLVSDGT
jgi:hypothetical protein